MLYRISAVCQGEILRIDSRDTLALTGHGNYVQGVCWDPLNEYIGTQSADRSIKLYRVRPLQPLFFCLVMLLLMFSSLSVGHIDQTKQSFQR